MTVLTAALPLIPSPSPMAMGEWCVDVVHQIQCGKPRPDATTEPSPIAMGEGRVRVGRGNRTGPVCQYLPLSAGSTGEWLG